MILLTFIVYVSACIYGTVSDVKNTTFYTWKNIFDGIPSDALVGGRDDFNRSTYIASVTMRSNDKQIVQINLDENHIPILHYEEDHLPFATALSILCTSEPDNFEWIDTDGAAVRYLYNRHLVVGGMSRGLPRVVARSHPTNGMVIVGYAPILEEKQYIRYVTKDKHGNRVGSSRASRDFQVLVYKKKC